jgi:serine/threonine protein kinase
MGLRAGDRFGAYEIQSLLGAGGMGEVYRARDPRLRRDVAIKVLPQGFTLDSDRSARFEREAQLLASLNCPQIAAIYGIEESGGERGLVLELVEGPTLAEKLRRGALPLSETLDIAGQLVDALDAAHDKGIVHRDLKPANIKITPEGVVKVLDFGLAKTVPGIAGDAHQKTVTADLTDFGLVVGTAAYMSPEQARGGAIDKRTDIWAFGCVLYEMLTGRSTFGRATVSDMIAAVIGSEPDWQPLGATPVVLRRLLTRLLEKDVRRRVRDIADVRPDLEEVRTGGSMPEAGVAKPSLRKWRSAALVSIVALAVVSLVAINGMRWRDDTARAGIIEQAIVSQLTSYDGSERSGAISPDGRSFVFVSNRGDTPDIWLRQISGGEPVPLTNDDSVESDLAFAPDGESIYFTRTDRSGTSIWRMGALGGQARRVLNNAQTPAPSRDGRYLAWSMPGPSGSSSLSMSGTDGSSSRVLVEKAFGQVLVGNRRPSWSPDGRRISYVSGGLFAPYNLFVVDVPDGRVRQLTHFDKSLEGVAAQAWLPDNRHIVVAYVAFPRALGSQDLGLLDAETGSIERLSTNVSDSFSEPSLSADGTRLLVTASRTQRELWRVPYGPDPDANGRGAIRVLDDSADPMWTYVTRDGKTLIFNNALVGSRNLWTLPLGSAEKPRQITSVPGDAVMHSSLSPDGSRVAFASSASGYSDIWVQHIDGSDLRQLTNDAAADAWPVWSPDGRQVVFASLMSGSWETRIVSSGGGPAQTVIEGFFRGDWISKPDGSGSWLVTSKGGAAEGFRLLDFERRSVVWESGGMPSGLSMPMFSPDAKYISIPVSGGVDPDEIRIYDVATGKPRTAARFDKRFGMLFRAAWVDGGRAFIVNRQQVISRIVMFDRFWMRGAR